MKITLNKLIGLSAGILLLTGLTSCIKNKGFANETDFSGLQDHVILLNAGLGNVGAANIAFPTDTTTSAVTADLASANPPPSSVTVTIAVDPAQVTAFNASHGTSYVLLPDSAFTLAATKLTIPAGQQFATTNVSFYKAKLDPTVSYMLPISIKDGGGKTLSTNENTIYYNVIGNAIAGVYKWDFTRWGNPNQTGSPDITFVGHTTSFVADNPNQIEVASGYYIGPRYVLSFVNTGGVLSNFKVIMNPDDVATMAAAGVVITAGPTITKADPIAGEYIFEYKTLTRYVIDRYYK